MIRLPLFHRSDGSTNLTARARRRLLAPLLAAALVLLGALHRPVAIAQSPGGPPQTQPSANQGPAGSAAPAGGPSPGAATPALPLHPPRRRNILILGSYESPSTCSVQQIREIESAISLAYPQSSIHIHYLVSPELRGQPESDSLRQKLAEALKARFASFSPELLVVVDTLAFRVLTENASDLFPGVPTVFSGVVRGRLAPDALTVRPTTGVFEEIDAAGTLDLMIRLQPRLKRVLAIAQGSDHAAELRRVTEQQFAAHEGAKPIEWAQSTKLADLRREVESLGPDEAALLLAFFDPKAFRERDDVMGLPWHVPFYTVYGSNINQEPTIYRSEEQGAVGGRVVSYPAMGRAAGGLAVRVLRGENPQSILPQERVGLVTVVDYRQLERLGISPRRVPEVATVINRPPSYLVRMWPYLLGGAMVILAEGAIIALLIRGRRRLRRVQATLDRERERYKLAVSNATESVWDWDVARDLTIWAGPLAERLGFGGTQSPERPTNSTWSGCLHPDDRERVQQALDLHLKSDAPYAVEYRLRMPDGDYRWFASRGRCRRDESGRPQRMTGTLTDVTDRVETERQLALSEERFRAVFEKHPFPLWIYDRTSMRFLAVNDAAVKKYGYSRAEFAELTLLDLRPPSERSKLTEFLEATDPTADYTGTWKHRTADGREIDVLVSTCQVPWLAGESTRLGAFVDITEKLWAEKLREHQNTVLELIASDAPIDAVLLEIVRGVQRRDPATLGSVLLLDPDGRTLRTAAAPDLPKAYCDAINGVAIGPGVGSCGTAMYRKERVIVSDIASDPLWQSFRDVALEHGLRACWSEPILDSHGRVLGSFAMYYREVRSPQEWELQLIATSARLAGMAIERRRLESEVRAAEARFRALFEQSAVGIVQVSAEGRFMVANLRACEILGREANDLVGRTFAEVTHPDDVQRNLDMFVEYTRSGDGYQLEKRYIRPDGTVVWANVNARFLRKPDGRIDYAISAIQDITEAVKFRERLAASEERYRRLLTDVRVIAWEADPGEFRFTFVAGQAEEILGYPAKSWLEAGFWERILHPSDRDWAVEFCKTKSAEGRNHEFEYRALHRDGRVVWIRDLVSVELLDERPVRARGVMIDVTEQKRAELELERFFQLSPVMLCTVTPSGHFQRVNPAFCRALGYTEAELLSRPYLEFAHPDDRPITDEEARRIHAQGQPGPFENHFLHADGTYRLMSWQSTHLSEDGLIYAAARDITSDRAATDALRRSEGKYRQIVETAREGVWLVDSQWKTTFVNSRMAEMIGLRPEQMLGRHIFDFCDDEARKEATADMADREQGLAAQHEFRLRHADGRDVWTLMSTNAVTDDDGRFIGALSMVTDISERREADQALRQSEATNRALLAAMPDLLFRVDSSGRYLYFKGPPNVPLLAEPKDFLGRTMREVLPRDLAETGTRALAAALESGDVQVYEYETFRDARHRWWEGRVVPASPGEALILVRDITSRREAEQALRDSQRRLSLLVNQAPIGVIVWNTRFEIQQWNPAAQRIFGFTPQEAVGRHGDLIVPPEVPSSVGEVWRELMAQRGGVYSVNDNITRSGQRIICEWNNTPLVGSDGTVIGVSSFVHDVTERVMSERRQALMMQELDHRVKNNMAAVLSLAEQTGRATTDFQEFQSTFMGRVRALARMHHILAASRWHGADLHTLITQVVEPYSGTQSGRLDVKGPEISLDPRAAQSMAMTLNELATNAAKHGALSSPHGRIIIRWTIDTPDGRPVVALRWSERGGPPTSRPKRRGLGIDLIEGAIIYQLGGKVEFLFPPEGLECILSAPVGEAPDNLSANPASVR